MLQLQSWEIQRFPGRLFTKKSIVKKIHRSKFVIQKLTFTKPLKVAVVVVENIYKAPLVKKTSEVLWFLLH